jgi:vitamin B12/bleomycin/antimicrobial peptide transport system ATP-binding/permease protein
MQSLGPFLKDAWRLALPYFNSEEKWLARGLLLAIVCMNLFLVAVNVQLSYWNRAFYNALQDRDWQAFLELMLLYRRTPAEFRLGFVPLATVFIVVAIYRTYLTQWLQIRWRNWMTGRVLDSWLADRAYYRISLTAAAGRAPDNPDQRIADDLRRFIGDSITGDSGILQLFLGLLSSVVTLLSFLTILWSLSGALRVFGISIPGYMVWVALVYAAIGSWLTHKVGGPLAALDFRQQAVEADFRFALARLRENVEGVALYHGEAEERRGLGVLFEAVIGNWWTIMRRVKQLNGLTVGYAQVAIIFPYLVAAPRYFAGQIALGGLTQTAGAFGQVEGALSWFVNAYASLASWRATVSRLASFQRSVSEARAAAAQGVAEAPAAGDGFALDDVTLALPGGETLLQGCDLKLPRGRSVVISGRSGSGKSTLFRALAGIWPFGSGQVRRPAANAMFLPQRPYLPLGSLRRATTYPADPAAFDEPSVVAALEQAGLGHLVPRLDERDDWAQHLSGGEQQRLAIARALLAKPDWLFLDEATSSLDPESEAELYAVLRRLLPHTTIVSIAHRQAVAAFHEQRLLFERATGGGRLAEAA